MHKNKTVIRKCTQFKIKELQLRVPWGRGGGGSIEAEPTLPKFMQVWKSIGIFNGLLTTLGKIKEQRSSSDSEVEQYLGVPQEVQPEPVVQLQQLPLGFLIQLKGI
jgi:hypothetical protein